ncbi:NADH-quinone oxidoreductase subunit J [Geomonas sp. RF6]|uniref:NADH-quinone oxidoreductase subunit J family protein n=1 Tax=Geomonas sp. RF6 TaxID=2897342 RepID=UPI001E58E014|nr:NADH-quinone oxidoreductase subunit J [Geomonas sp. RF6]UFS72024.1 NADH-quinone oxidoreductase subunit J [Geomonas sp. RF6]
MEAVIFYILAAMTLLGTFCAITEKHAVHAIIYLVTSFFALAIIFYLLGAPTVAAFEVIIYAGAIMVLFLFVIMMLDLSHPERMNIPRPRDCWPALVIFAVICGSVLVLAASHTPAIAPPFRGVTVREFSLGLFRRYGVAVELISMQLLFALVGALYLGRRR